MAYTYSLSLSLSLSLGATHDQSLTNFKHWLNAFALRYCDSDCLVKNLHGQRVNGLFHHMRKGEHEDFEGHHTWASQCQAGNISAGQYFSVAPSGHGEMQFMHGKIRNNNSTREE